MTRYGLFSFFLSYANQSVLDNFQAAQIQSLFFLNKKVHFVRVETHVRIWGEYTMVALMDVATKTPIIIGILILFEFFILVCLLKEVFVILKVGLYLDACVENHHMKTSMYYTVNWVLIENLQYFEYLVFFILLIILLLFHTCSTV